MRVTHLDAAELTAAAPHPADGVDTLVIVLFQRSLADHDALLAELGPAFPRSVIVGCSTAGHFTGDTLIDEPLIVVAQFERSQLRSVGVDLPSIQDSFDVGRTLGAELRDPDLRGVLVLSDGLSCNGTALVDGLLSELPDDTVIFGGLAADGDAFETTMVMDRTGVSSGRVVAVGFIGDRLVFGSATGGGWERFGLERTITGASDSVLTGLDSEPALDLYRRYLGDRADELPGSALLFPLAIRANESCVDHHVVRTVLAVDDDLGSMTFAGDMPVGWRAQMMRASFDDLVDGAADAAELVHLDAGIIGDTLCLAVSCVGRRLALGSRVEEELDAVIDVLGHDSHVVGFYSYGELAPDLTGRCALHNQTMTLARFGER